MSSGGGVVFTFRERSASGGQQEVQEEWSEEHAKLLYLISRYATCANTAHESEGWIRHIPLLVLIYEGCVSGHLNFDYAPASVRITQGGQSRRLWLNTSHDGRAATDDLRQRNLLNGLKLAATDFEPVTAYQASKHGLHCVKQIPQRLKDEVDAFITADDSRGGRALLHVHFQVNTPMGTPLGAGAGISQAADASSEDDESEHGAKTDVRVGSRSPANYLRRSFKRFRSDNKVPTPTARDEPPPPRRQRQRRLGSAMAVGGDGSTAQAPLTTAEEQIAAGDAITRGCFVLRSADGTVARRSAITESEDVSYVSSPFLPQCVRNARNQRAMTSNEHRAAECARGTSNIRDELSEAIQLGQVLCLVGEWIPFGANQIVALNERLGARERCQGGFFSAMIDRSPDQLNFQCDPGLTNVTILDYDFVRFINFEAAIHYPEDEGIVQIENFGMHLNVDGTVFYGLKVEAVMQRTAERVSLDLLSRMLVDVHQDSSMIMDDLLSSYQRAMLNTIFLGDTKNRGKFNMIVADTIDPFLPAAEYLDGGEYENELQQLLGNLHSAYDVGEDGVLVVGRDGLLVAGPNAKSYEPLLVCYTSLLTCETFLRHFFMRIFIVDDLMKQIRALINDFESDPAHVGRIRLMISDASRDLVLLSELVEYLRESLHNRAFPPRPADAAGARLFQLLGLVAQHRDVTLRTRDLIKLLEGGRHELRNLQQMVDVINTMQLEGVCANVQANTKHLVDASAANERSSSTLEVMQVILAGSFAFDVVDRVSGGTLNIEVPEWVNDALTRPIINVPFLWFLLNVAWLVLCCLALWSFMRHVARQGDGALTLRIRVDRPLRLARLRAFLDTRALEVTDATLDPQKEVQKVSWFEQDEALWQGQPPRVELQVDTKHAFLLALTFRVNERKTRLEPLEDELCRILFGLLAEAGVLGLGEAGDRPSSELDVFEAEQQLSATPRTTPRVRLRKGKFEIGPAAADEPASTPFEGGFFRVKLVLTKDFPHSPPRGYFLTRIYHPNVAPNGDICVNTLKKDWKADMGISHVLAVIRCLLIVPFPESSLNDEAGRLFMESYEEYARRARLHTRVHAKEPIVACDAAGEGEGDEGEGEGGGDGKGKGLAGVKAGSSVGVGAAAVGASGGTPTKRVKGGAATPGKGGKAKGDKKKSKKKKGGLNRL
eukprot:g2067.t1